MMRAPQAGMAGTSLIGMASVPSWRTVATVAGMVVTAVLILELGIWYFIGLIALYAALDVAQRAEMRRDARNRMAILASVGHHAPGIFFAGHARHCHQAAWVAKQLGWIAGPMAREGVLRRSVRFRCVPGAAPLDTLLDALNDEKLATRIRLLDAAPSFGRRLSEHGFWEA